LFGCLTMQRVTAWAMLGLYGLIASGLPLPMAMPPAGSATARKIAGKDRSTPFPCMDKACGCDTAERCFTNCCCHTPAETLAWARARGIEASVIDALTRRVAAAAPAPQAAGSCCAAKAKQQTQPSCCAAADDAICSDYRSLAADARDKPAEDATPVAPAGDREDEAPVRGTVMLRAMLACSGIMAELGALGVSLPPPSLVACEIAWPQVGTVTLIDQRTLGTGGPPDLPPPRA
jgi:hypothetical protein